MFQRVVVLLAIVLAAGLIPRWAAADTPAEAERRPVSCTFATGIGAERAFDSYLSPLPYSGSALSLSARWQKAMPANPRRLTMHFDAAIQGAATTNGAGNAHIYDADISAVWGMRWHTMAGRLRIECGGAVQAEGGALYSTRNGNNPASARLSIGLAAEGAAKYPVRIGRLHVLLEEEISLPLASVFFSPAYGETYYEIYMGNHKGLAHFGWPGNRFCISNFAGGTLMLGRVGLRIGYRLDAATSWICNINTHRIAHRLELGITTTLPSLGSGRTQSAAINAIY